MNNERGDRDFSGVARQKRSGHKPKPSSRNRKPGRPSRHAGRGGRTRGSDSNVRYAPQSEAFRDRRVEQRKAEPEVPSEVSLDDLDPLVRQDLRVLSKKNADDVGLHIAAVSHFIDEDPERALVHGRAAKNRAGRVSVAREANGVAAYRAGQWKEALAELRAARRMSGGPGAMAAMADCERALGRPRKAIDLLSSPEAGQLDWAGAIELRIVVAGAYHDVGEHDAALEVLAAARPAKDAADVTGLRLAYAYADALLAAGNPVEAREWFLAVSAHDEEGFFDAAERIDEIDAAGAE